MLLLRLACAPCIDVQQISFLSFPRALSSLHNVTQLAAYVQKLVRTGEEPLDPCPGESEFEIKESEAEIKKIVEVHTPEASAVSVYTTLLLSLQKMTSDWTIIYYTSCFQHYLSCNPRQLPCATAVTLVNSQLSRHLQPLFRQISVQTEVNCNFLWKILSKNLFVRIWMVVPQR